MIIKQLVQITSQVLADIVCGCLSIFYIFIFLCLVTPIKIRIHYSGGKNVSECETLSFELVMRRCFTNLFNGRRANSMNRHFVKYMYMLHICCLHEKSPLWLLLFDEISLILAGRDQDLESCYYYCKITVNVIPESFPFVTYNAC